MGEILARHISFICLFRDCSDHFQFIKCQCKRFKKKNRFHITKSPILSLISGEFNVTPQNCADTTLDRNDEATIKQRRSKESMEACQGVSKTVNDAAKISHSMNSPDIKPTDGGGVSINKSDKRSAQPISCQGNVPQFVKSNDVETDQSRHAEEQGCSIKCKLNNLENQARGIDQGTSSQQNGSKTSDRIKSYFKDAPTIFSLDEKAARSKIRNGRMPIEGRLYAKRRVSSPRYASFLRMLRKEEADERFRGNSRRDEAEKLQQRGLSAERYETIKRKERLAEFRRDYFYVIFSSPIKFENKYEKIVKSNVTSLRI